MDHLLILVVGVLGGLLVVMAAALGAWARTARHNKEIQELQRRLAHGLDRVARLESAVAAGVRAETVAPAPVPVPAPAATAASIPPVPARPTAQPRPAGVEPLAEPQSTAPPIGPRPMESPPAVEPTPVVTTAPKPPAAPAPPNPITEWLLRGNPFAKLGIVLMFFGLAYLLKFASDRGMLPIEIRLAGAAAISTGLLLVGWRLRARNPVYGLTLQGGSIGALYLTSFAAFRFYSLLPHGLVFTLLVVICAASVALAVLQRAQSLALIASLGGFLAPILLSTGGGNHVALFSYYALLSAGILAVSVWQTWRPLTLVGFAFTFGVGTLWGLDSYRPELYASAQLFLALNLLMYGVVAVLVSIRRTNGKADPFIDGTLVFGAPLVGFGLQAGLTRHWEYGPAFSALVFGALYLLLAWFTLRRWPERVRRLTISFLALGGGFVTLAIPLALSARFTAMAWALEGLGVLWAGRGERHRRMIASGTGLLVLAASAAVSAWGEGVDTPTFLLMASVLSLTWMAGAWLWTTIEIKRAAGWNEGVSRLLLFGGVVGWLLLIVEGSNRSGVSRVHETMLALAVMSVTVVAWSVVATRLRWTALGESAFVLWPFAALTQVYQLDVGGGHPLPWEWQSGAWIATFAAGWHLLRWARDEAPDRPWRPFQHATFVWLAVAVAMADVQWRLDRLGWGADEWKSAGSLVLSFAFVLPVWRMSLRQHWAVATYPRAYWVWGLLPPVVIGGVWLATANLLDGPMPGRPYLPILNPLEQAAAFALLMIVVWNRAIEHLVARAAVAAVRLASIAGLVWWLNGLLLRTLALVGGVTWSFEGLWASTFIQTSMALAWTAAALVSMALAARRAHRQAWFIGAGALVVVVVKLFLVDSARGGGLARAVAFIGVSLLVLVIGYLAPLPPRAGQEGGSSS